jgi:hypothetical protein
VPSLVEEGDGSVMIYLRNRGMRVLVAVFAVIGRVHFYVSVASFAAPTGERLSEFLKNLLT